MSDATSPSVDVVVATFNRPDNVRICLEHLEKQTLTPDEIVVVDSSPHRLTADVVADFPGVRYIRNDAGPGTLATSRAIGVAETRSDIIAFIDDDAYAEPDWLENIVARYADPAVGAVGGRASNGRPGEELEGLDEVGRLLPDGTLTGNFAADTGHDIEVDHVLGANMSVRRTAVDGIGGIVDLFPGTCLREESDIMLRIGRAGWRIVYTPSALVEHVAAPYTRGRRFDVRYTYYGHRNHIVLLSHTFGMGAPILRRYVGTTLRGVGGTVAEGAKALVDGDRSPRQRVRSLGGKALHASATLGGLAAGTTVAARTRLAARRTGDGRVTGG
ncbi:glycosyltransferase family 2 protein [Humibacillus xanthopallidus]|uniref:GT2 family glycosyltransferase n=1 Tax=Humibacillus xanthopallidus TaxID=412689 RepID=A0A543I0A8_9MICO|nr:glycosyltransferase family 2 protein [Humibacillus xanthopallidus]TQM64001.1 GT2 family glycosyltransferase [Humibacillus xanthopallidus]